jgi:hypothetical protein
VSDTVCITVLFAFFTTIPARTPHWPEAHRFTVMRAPPVAPPPKWFIVPDPIRLIAEPAGHDHVEQSRHEEPDLPGWGCLLILSLLFLHVVSKVPALLRFYWSL